MFSNDDSTGNHKPASNKNNEEKDSNKLAEYKRKKRNPLKFTKEYVPLTSDLKSIPASSEARNKVTKLGRLIGIPQSGDGHLDIGIAPHKKSIWSEASDKDAKIAHLITKDPKARKKYFKIKLNCYSDEIHCFKLKSNEYLINGYIKKILLSNFYNLKFPNELVNLIYSFYDDGIHIYTMKEQLSKGHHSSTPTSFETLFNRFRLKDLGIDNVYTGEIRKCTENFGLIDTSGKYLICDLKEKSVIHSIENLYNEIDLFNNLFAIKVNDKISIYALPEYSLVKEIDIKCDNFKFLKENLIIYNYRKDTLRKTKTYNICESLSNIAFDNKFNSITKISDNKFLILETNRLHLININDNMELFFEKSFENVHKYAVDKIRKLVSVLCVDRILELYDYNFKLIEKTALGNNYRNIYFFDSDIYLEKFDSSRLSDKFMPITFTRRFGQ